MIKYGIKATPRWIFKANSELRARREWTNVLESQSFLPPAADLGHCEKYSFLISEACGVSDRTSRQCRDCRREAIRTSSRRWQHQGTTSPPICHTPACEEPLGPDTIKMKGKRLMRNHTLLWFHKTNERTNKTARERAGRDWWLPLAVLESLVLPK